VLRGGYQVVLNVGKIVNAKVVPSKATLVVCAVSLVGQWIEEVSALDVPRMFPECSPNVPRMFPQAQSKLETPLRIHMYELL
jgi:hypothetical protein